MVEAPWVGSMKQGGTYGGGGAVPVSAALAIAIWWLPSATVCAVRRWSSSVLAAASSREARS